MESGNTRTEVAIKTIKSKKLTMPYLINTTCVIFFEAHVTINKSGISDSLIAMLKEKGMQSYFFGWYACFACLCFDLCVI